MFALNYLRRCYEKNLYLFWVLILLDVITTFYSGGVDHPLTRHMFIAYDLVSGFANILFWIILFVPIALDIVQERGTFGVSIFCRISKQRYMRLKSVTLFLYCVSFFGLSMIISLAVGMINGYTIGTGATIVKIYMLLVFLSFTLLIFENLLGWLFNSSYVMMVFYSGVIAITQIPNFQEKFSIIMLLEKFHWSICGLLICSILVLLLMLHIMKYKDFIGIKKGMTI